MYNNTQDKEPRIRDLAAEAIGALAGSSSMVPIASTSSELSQNPVLKVILEVLSDQKREIQAAACAALTEVRLQVRTCPLLFAKQICSNHDSACLLQYLTTAQTLPLRAARQIVKYLNLPNFLAKGSLIMAIGRCPLEDTKVSGLLAQPLSNWISLVPDVIGQDNSSGLLGAMQSPEWQTRRAAVDCLRSLIVSAGPGLTGSMISMSEV